MGDVSDGLAVDPRTVVSASMFLFFVSFSMFWPAVPQVVLHLSCLRLGLFGEGACSASTEASSIASGWSLWMNVCETVPTILFAGACGRFSDEVGRRPILLLGAAVQILNQLTYVVVLLCFPDTSSLPLLLVASGVVGCSGGLTCLLANLFGIVADTTTPTERTAQFAWIQSALFAGMIVGPPLGGYLTKAYGFAAPFVAAAVICCVNWCLIWGLLVENRKERRGFHPMTPILEQDLASPPLSSSWVPPFLTTNTVVLLRNMAFKSKGSVTLSLIFFLTVLPFFAYIDLFILYAKLKYSLSATAIGIFQMCENLGKTLFVVLVAAWLKDGTATANRTTLRNTDILLASTVISAPAYVAYAFVPATARWRWLLFALTIPLGAIGLILPTVRALFSIGVSADQQGETLTAVAALETLVQLFSSLVFVPIYRASVKWFPGLAFVVMGGLLVGAALYLHCGGAASVIENNHESTEDEGAQLERLLHGMNRETVLFLPHYGDGNATFLRKKWSWGRSVSRCVRTSVTGEVLTDIDSEREET